jgi:hypothetical protein
MLVELMESIITDEKGTSRAAAVSRRKAYSRPTVL